MKEFIELSKELKRRNLKKEAGLLDEVATIMSEVFGGSEDILGEQKDSEEGSEDSSDKDADQSSVGDQVSLFNYTTENFDLCPGAVEAFEKIKAMEMSGDSRERALSAIQDTDRLLGIEREVLDAGEAAQDQIREAIGLSRTISNYVGLISEEIDQDLAEDFEFLDMHIEKIMGK